MAHRKKRGQSGRKGGSIIDEPFDPPSVTQKPKNKHKKPRKQSRGK